MKVVLAGVGSRGDFQPLLALAVALKDRGHDVVMYGLSNFAAWAAREGIAFEGSEIDSDEMAAATTPATLQKTPHAIKTLVLTLRAELEVQFERLTRLAADSDAVLGMGFCLAGRSAAELAGVPYHSVIYTPQILPSAEYPPPMPVYDRPWLNPWSHRLMSYMIRRVYGRQLDDLRRSRGLPPRHDTLDAVTGHDDVLLAFDREFARAPADAPVSCVQLASFVYSDSAVLSPELEEFLNAGDKPFYFGFGSMADVAPAATRQMVEVIARELGVRAILFQKRPDPDPREGRASDRVHVVSSVSHAALLPRVSVMIHHGGSGTSAAAARAGVPQIVVPHYYDQFFFADRLHRCGVAPRPLGRRRLTAKRLKTAIGQVLDDASFRSAAQRLAESVRMQNGIAMAVQYLEARYGASTSVRRDGVPQSRLQG